MQAALDFAGLRRSPIRRRCAPSCMPSRSIRRRRWRRRKAAATVTTGWLDAVRDGIAEEMRRDPHIMYFGEGTGERGGTLRPHQGALAGVRAEAHDRHADLRAGLHRRRARRLGHRRAHDRRPDVRRLHVRGRRPDHPPGRQAPLHDERPDERADGDPRRRRRHAERRTAPQRHLSSDLGAHPGADRLHAVDPGRRQGSDQDGAARCGPGDLPREQGAVRVEGRGSRGRASGALRRGADRARRHRPHHRLGRVSSFTARSRRPRVSPARESSAR